MRAIEYEIKESKRAKRTRITIHPDGRVVVTRPHRTAPAQIEAFVAERQEWIDGVLTRIERRRKKYGSLVALPKPRRGSRAYNEATAAARLLVQERLSYFNQVYRTSYGTISIRNQKTRWGSCSARNALSFNYQIAFLPRELADYIIVHELCHTLEHNHSEKFWASVARTLPNHAHLRRTLHTRYSL